MRDFHADREQFYDADGPRVRVGREIKVVPREIQALATQSGGLNFLGEPNYRVVWGWSRLCLIGGEWTDFDSQGNYVQTVGQYRWEPKNMPFDRWHLETWLPPSHFISREHWHEITEEEFNGEKFAALGPFPSRGEYEACYCFENADGTYQELFSHVVETVCKALNYQKTISALKRQEAIAKREEKKKTDDYNFAFDLADDAVPAFYGKPQVGVTRDIERNHDE